MITGAWKLFSLFRETIAGGDTPRQIAFGVAMGMMTGLIPKDSLFVAVLGIMLLVSTANLFSAFVTGFLFSWIGFALDPLSHSLGKWILTQPGLQSTFVALYETPLVAWTRFENTIVTGSTVMAIVAFLPVYFFVSSICKKYGPGIHAMLCQYIVYRWISGAEVSADSKTGMTAEVAS